MIIIPIPEGFNMEGRDGGEPFEMVVMGRIKDGNIELDSVEGVELTEAPPEEDVEMDEAALESAMGGGMPA